MCACVAVWSRISNKTKCYILWTLNTITSQAQDGRAIWGTNVQAPMEKLF